MVRVIAPDGRPGTIPEDDLSVALEEGYKPEAMALALEQIASEQFTHPADIRLPLGHITFFQRRQIHDL